MLVMLSPAYYAQNFKKAGHRGIPSICPWQKRKTICLELRQLEVVCQCYSSVTTSRDLDIILMGIASSYGACFLVS